MTLFQKFIVAAYRYLAIAVLVAILGTGAGYALVTLFYTSNYSWVAPVVISQTHDRIIHLKAELYNSQQKLDTLEASITSLKAESLVLESEATKLTALVGKSKQSQNHQLTNDIDLARKLAPLTAQKAEDVQRTEKVMASLKGHELLVTQELKAGLITKDDAARTLASLNSYKVSATDSAASSIALESQVTGLRRSADTLSGHTATSASALELLSRSDLFESQLSHVRLKLAENLIAITNKTQEAAQLRKLTDTLKDTAYVRVAQSVTPLSFAFVPYLNEDAAKSGAIVYDCALQILWCKKVGVIKRIYHDEERGQHPLFHLDMRGTLVELELTQNSAAKSRVLFVGSAPLFF